MRLAYTAMTRARLRVVWTATDAGIDQGEHRPSRFLIAASGVGELAQLGPPREVIRDPVTLTEAETALRRDLLDPTAPPVRRLAAAGALAQSDVRGWDASSFPGVPVAGPDSPILGDTIHLSPSQADSYQRCPRQYALERRLRLGSASSPYAHFGSLVHAALEKAERPIIGTGLHHAAVDHAIECLEDVWADADFGTPELNRAWLRKAIDAITKLYERWPSRDGVPIDLEMKVEAVIAGVPWVGVIDRIESTQEGLRIVDYKTSTTAMTVAEAAESLQLGFYSIALDAGEDRVGIREPEQSLSRPARSTWRVSKRWERKWNGSQQPFDPRIGRPQSDHSVRGAPFRCHVRPGRKVAEPFSHEPNDALPRAARDPRPGPHHHPGQGRGGNRQDHNGGNGDSQPDRQP